LFKEKKFAQDVKKSRRRKKERGPEKLPQWGGLDWLKHELFGEDERSLRGRKEDCLGGLKRLRALERLLRGERGGFDQRGALQWNEI